MFKFEIATNGGSTSERLSLRLEAVWPERASIVDNTHGLVAGIARQSDRVIFDNVLLDDGLTSCIELRLCLAFLVDVGLRNEAVVTRDMLGHFSSADGELVDLIRSFGCVGRQDASRVVAMLAERVGELGHIVAA